MKITIEFEGQTASVYNPEVVTITEAIELFQKALYAIGYTFKGELQIVEEDEEK